MRFSTMDSTRPESSARRRAVRDGGVRADGSPAIDHGANFTQQPFDQRGVPRVIGSSADIGAFESDCLFTDGFNP